MKNKKCTPGHQIRCAASKNPACKCDCDGKNHGSDRPAAQSMTKPSGRAAPSVLFMPMEGNVTGQYDGRKRTLFVGTRRLKIGDSLKLRSHSPTGFSWGYGGSGPAQTALAILLEIFGKETALSNYQSFKSDCIATLDGDKGFFLSVDDIRKWLKGRK